MYDLVRSGGSVARFDVWQGDPRDWIEIIEVTIGAAAQGLTEPNYPDPQPERQPIIVFSDTPLTQEEVMDAIETWLEGANRDPLFKPSIPINLGPATEGPSFTFVDRDTDPA